MLKRSSRRRKFVTPGRGRRGEHLRFLLSQFERAVGHLWACCIIKPQVPVMTPTHTRGKIMQKLLLCALGAIVASVDHGMKLQQTLGSARAAEEAKNYDTALSKLEQISTQLAEWRSAIVAAQKEAATPAEPAAAPEPPAESIPFSVNSTHVPDKCTRKSEEGAVMKVHYVGKLVATKKIFASSFHTGSQPFRFVLGSDEVISAWNQGLGDMCEGERRRLMVPWDMGYGEKGAKGVPPYSDLQYDFELVELSLPKLSSSKKKAKAKAEL